MKTICITVLFQLFFASICYAQADIRMVCWNLEGNGQAKLDFIERALEEKDGVHLWGLVEVRENRADKYAEAIGADESGEFKSLLGTTGNNIRLQIVYDSDKLELVESEELTDEFDDLASISRQRIPLVGHFKGKATGQEFKFVVVHLNRGDVALRHQQATKLRQWAIAQGLPVIMCGDFNVDFHVFNGDSGVRDQGFDNLIEGGLVKWLRPVSLVKTEDSDRFVTVLDFFFYTNETIGWSGESRILDREGDQVATELDFDDNSTTPDHRPVDAVLHMVAAPTDEDDSPVMPAGNEDDRIQAILNRIEAMEAQLKELREAVQEID